MDLRDSISLPEAAKRYCVSDTTIRRWCDKGSFPPPVVLPGGMLKFRAADIARFDLWLDHRSAARRTGAEKPAPPDWDAIEQPEPEPTRATAEA